MKQPLSLFLVSLILFNTIGYYGVLMVMEAKLNARMLEKIDQNADEISGDLMLTIPVTLPYSNDAENYQRVDGRVVYDGEVYRLVKQKLYHSNLYIICIRDDRSTQIREEMDEYSKTFSNQQSEKSDSAVKIVVSFAKYYLLYDHHTRPVTGGWTQTLSFVMSDDHYLSRALSSLFRPPQLS